VFGDWLRESLVFGDWLRESLVYGDWLRESLVFGDWLRESLVFGDWPLLYVHYGIKHWEEISDFLLILTESSLRMFVYI